MFSQQKKFYRFCGKSFNGNCNYYPFLLLKTDICGSKLRLVEAYYFLLFRYSIFKELGSFAGGEPAILKTCAVFGTYLMEMNGIEPMTPCLQGRCSPS